MPSFRGTAIFGTCVQMATGENPNADQRNAFFGVSGVESLRGGGRGRLTSVKGVLFGPSASDLDAAETTFRSYNDGVAGPLVDSFGRTWPSVKLQSFQPVGRIHHDGRGYYREYQAEFYHLV